MLRKRRRITLRTKLLAGFGAVGLLIAALLLLSHHFLAESAQRMEASLSAEVRPLARMNHLQARLHRVRVLEVELPRLTDYFAVTSHLELLRSEEQVFSDELAAFVRDAAPSDNAAALPVAWQRYRADLHAIAAQAATMDMKRVAAIASFESAVRFKLIAQALQDASERIEQRAQSARDAALRRQQQQRLAFVLTSALGLFLIAACLFLFARSLASRVRMLRDAAQRIAVGEPGVDIALPGEDELSDLGRAFDAMRQQVQARERDLRAAYCGQEARIEERTRELNDSNRKLRCEIEERKRAEQRLRLLSQAIEQSPASVLITDVDTRIEYVNETFVRRTGSKREQVVGAALQEIEPDRMPAEQYRHAWETVRAGETWHGEIASRHGDGSLVWERDNISPVADGGGAITHFVVIREDVTLRKQQEEKILFQAQYDHLTRLPNRLLAMDRLSHAIAAAQRNGTRVALMFIDFDDFKKVNDSLGHDAGDALLVDAAQRLRDAVRASDTVARQGGDEFLVIMSDLRETAEAELVADKVIAAFSRHFTLGENDAVVTPSIGLAIYPDDGDTPGELMRNADLAMYDAKEAGGSTWRFFNSIIHQHAAQRLALERDLRQALAQHEFRLHYQPVLGARDGRVAGAEALLRWDSASHGLVQPERFIGLVEHTGLIVDIGRWVLRTACLQAAQWRRAGHADFRIAVNVSPRQFRGSGFLDHVREALQESGLPSANLQIEITEGLLIRNAPEVNDILQALDAMGVGIAMDDFGTGYSSLSYLKRFPFHAIKIDREFVRDLAHDRDDRALVTAAISMGKELGLSIVAEGVESAEQLAFLAAQGCDFVQGFHFSRAVPAADFARDWLAASASAIVD